MHDHDWHVSIDITVQKRLGLNATDVAATRTVISLLDPLSQTRITYPCRSTQCAHLACFDGVFFLKV